MGLREDWRMGQFDVALVAPRASPARGRSTPTSAAPVAKAVLKGFGYFDWTSNADPARCPLQVQRVLTGFGYFAFQAGDAGSNPVGVQALSSSG